MPHPGHVLRLVQEHRFAGLSTDGAAECSVSYAGWPAVQKEQVPKPPSIGINTKSDGIAVVQLAEEVCLSDVLPHVAESIFGICTACKR